MLIGREDIIATIGPEPNENASPEEPSLMRRIAKERKLYSRSFKSRCGQMPRYSPEVTSASSSSVARENLGDGLDDVIDSIGTRRFSSDNRIDEVSTVELL